MRSGIRERAIELYIKCYPLIFMTKMTNKKVLHAYMLFWQGFSKARGRGFLEAGSGRGFLDMC